MTDNIELLNAKRKIEDVLLGNTGSFGGVGLREKDNAVTVYLRDYSESSKRKAYELIGSRKANGYDIQFINSGNVSALQTATTYHRPINGGDSISHGFVTAGTLGCVVYDADTKQMYGLSNNHVLAAGSTISSPYANKGDTVYAPGCYDSGFCMYPIGSLVKYIPLQESVLNFVDCAVFKPDRLTDVSTNITNIGELTGYTEAQENMLVRKQGRTTGLTSGKIMDYNATIEVDYGGLTLKFVNCIVTEHMGNGGDSGSALVTEDNEMVGLLFAGSDTITVYNRASYVLQQLNVTVTPDGTVPQPTYTVNDIISQNYYYLQSIVYATVGITAGIGIYSYLDNSLNKSYIY
jgi:hypothetical protein